MPLTLTLTEGVIPADSEKEAVSRITNSMLRHHGLLGNTVMTPNITAHVSVLPKSSTFSGGEEFSGVWMEWKVPSFAFASRELQLAHFADATEIIRELSDGKQPIENIYSNVIHTVDGSWNFNGIAMTNGEIGNQISKG
ncbi:MAG: 4-oxalocrotonate tautomerase [Kangiellaceae bacterium]|nr:4-oxalocrotonate tautomerase [Kangiellaceae bacterium]